MRCGRTTPRWPSRGRSWDRSRGRYPLTTARIATTPGCPTPSSASRMAGWFCRRSRRDTRARSTATRAASSCSCSAGARTASPAGWRTTWRSPTIATRVTTEQFDADYDQRHTLNMYGVYRFSDRMSFSSRFRAGSNFPAPGYYEARTLTVRDRNCRGVFPQHARNNAAGARVQPPRRARQPHVLLASTRFTLFAEVLNLYARENVRASQPGHQRHHTSGLRVVRFDVSADPSAGLSFEF